MEKCDKNKSNYPGQREECERYTSFVLQKPHCPEWRAYKEPTHLVAKSLFSAIHDGYKKTQPPRSKEEVKTTSDAPLTLAQLPPWQLTNTASESGEEAALSTTKKTTLFQGEFEKEGGIFFSVLEKN